MVGVGIGREIDDAYEVGCMYEVINGVGLRKTVEGYDSFRYRTKYCMHLGHASYHYFIRQDAQAASML